MMNKINSDYNRAVWAIIVVFLLVFIISAALYHNTIYIEEILGFLLLSTILFYIGAFEYFEKKELKFKLFIGALSLAIISLFTLHLLGLIDSRQLFPASITPLTFFLASIGLKMMLRKFFKGKFIYNEESDEPEVKKRKEMALMHFPLVATMFIVFLIHDFIFK